MGFRNKTQGPDFFEDFTSQARQLVQAVEFLTHIYAASPDGDSLAPESLLFTWQDTPQGRIYTAELPPLAYWMTLWVLTEV